MKYTYRTGCSLVEDKDKDGFSYVAWEAVTHNRIEDLPKRYKVAVALLDAAAPDESLFRLRGVGSRWARSIDSEKEMRYFLDKDFKI